MTKQTSKEVRIENLANILKVEFERAERNLYVSTGGDMIDFLQFVKRGRWKWKFLLTDESKYVDQFEHH